MENAPSHSETPSWQLLSTRAQQAYRAGQWQEAQDLAQQVLQQQPEELRATYVLGLVADQLGQPAQAELYYRRVIALKPNSAEVHNLLGNVLQRLTRFSEAVPCYHQAIALQPDYPAAFNNLGAAHQELGQFDEAIASYQQALKLKPDYADVYYNMGNAYRNWGNFQEAIALYRQTLALQPNYIKAYNNLGLVYYDLAQPDLAIAEYQRAIAMQPDYADVHQNLALALLLKGDLLAGFQEYEWRWVATGPDNHPLPKFSQPLWDGSNLRGKTILIYAEQGYGDTLQFIRYLPLVAAQGGRVLLECQPALVRLLAEMPHVEQILTQGDRRPPFDTHLPLLSLPRIFQSTLETLPCQIPYLTALSNPTIPQLSACYPPSFHVGIVWAGSPSNRNDRNRSCPLENLLPLFNAFEGGTIRFHSLQKGGRASEIVPLAAQGTIEDWNDRLQDFADTAALIQQLDCVITVDTSVAHLAGAMGKPTWLLLSYSHDWRWLLNRPDSPWYPSVRIFTQPSPGDWASVVQQVIQTLEVEAIAPPGNQKLAPSGSPNLSKNQAQKMKRQANKTAREQRKAKRGFAKETPLASAQLPLSASPHSVPQIVPQTTQNSLPPVPAPQASQPRQTIPLTLRPAAFPPTHVDPGDSIATQQQTVAIAPTPSKGAEPAEPQILRGSGATPLPIGIGWEIGTNTGWRVYGLNLALQLLKHGQITPVPLLPLAIPAALNPLHRALLEPLTTYQRQLGVLLEQNPDKQVGCSFWVLKAMGNRGVMSPAIQRLTGKRNIGVIFSEDTQWDQSGLAIARAQELMIAGSTWNAEVLKSYGISSVKTVLQGIDPTLFHPAPKAGLLRDRFVIFSGGKLEYRKGQDIVVAAFKAFHARHPEALLLTAWHNPWQQTMGEIERAGYLVGLPQISPHGQLHIKVWLQKNGIPETAVIDVGAIANYQAAPIMREADVAIFPNRAEGGTNLMAMECLACGVPTLLSANTGHLDLISEDHCYPLRDQGPVSPTQQYLGTEGWGESSVEEIVETLEFVYQNRQAAQQRGVNAARFMQAWTWENQIKQLLEAIA